MKKLAVFASLLISAVVPQVNWRSGNFATESASSSLSWRRSKAPPEKGGNNR